MAKSLSDILSSGNSADKFRDHIGETLLVTDVVTVNTKNGESVQLLVETDDKEQLAVWAPSVVARQALDLADNGLLPVRLRFGAETSVNDREYFTLEDPNAEPAPDEESAWGGGVMDDHDEDTDEQGAFYWEPIPRSRRTSGTSKPVKPRKFIDVEALKRLRARNFDARPRDDSA